MNTFNYILVGLSIFTLSSLVFGNPATAIEKAKYTVLEKEDDFELRQYDGQIVAETFVEGSLKSSGNDGFRRLYAYISGDNKKKAIHLHDRAGGPGSQFTKNTDDCTRHSGKKRWPMAHYLYDAG